MDAGRTAAAAVAARRRILVRVRLDQLGGQGDFLAHIRNHVARLGHQLHKQKTTRVYGWRACMHANVEKVVNHASNAYVQYT